MALQVNVAQLSLFPMEPAVVMAAQPAQAVSTAPPIYGFQKEGSGTVAPEAALETGIRYLREQGGPGHRFTQTEVAKAVFAFRRWMEAMPEDEEGSRYARYFITEFVDSGYCPHPDEYPAYAPRVESAEQSEEAALGEATQDVDEDVADPAAQAEEAPVESEAPASEEDVELQLEGDTLQETLGWAREIEFARVWAAITGPLFMGKHAHEPWVDFGKILGPLVDEYRSRMRGITSLKAIRSTTDAFLQECRARKYAMSTPTRAS